MAEREYAAGETIFRAGDPSECAYRLEAGRIEIVREEAVGDVVLAVLEPGEIFGEMGLVDERPRSLTARALEPARVTTVGRDEFVDMLLHRPQDSLAYVRHLFERLRAMNQRATEPPPRGSQATAVASAVRLLPASPRAGEVLPPEVIEIDRFPFRVGRALQKGRLPGLEQNHLVLPDAPPYHVSRNHFAVDFSGGQLLVRDRGSYLGTIVDGAVLGGGQGGSAELALAPGDHEIVVGSGHSPFKLTVRVEAAAH
jgi:CRP-like cAMP-binding protein